jgi:hypothetical protein
VGLLPAPSVGDRGNPVPLDPFAAEKRVLGRLLGGFGKGGISALRLSKRLGVSWSTAQHLLRKLRIAIGHRDRLYRLSDGSLELKIR